MSIKRAMRGLHIGRKMDVIGHRLGAIDAAATAHRQVNVSTADIDASAGGTAQEAPVATIPAGRLILGVVIEVVTPFNGDATRTVDCLGVTLANAGLAAGTQEGGSVMLKTAEATDVTAEWTNTADATAGVARVTVVWA